VTAFLLVVALALGMVVTVALGVAGLRKPLVEAAPGSLVPLSWRPCSGTREALLRGLALALLLVPLALMSVRDVARGAASAAAIATVCAGLVAAGLVEHAGARRRQPIVTLMIGTGATLSVLLATVQQVYAEGMLRGGTDAALSEVTRLASGALALRDALLTFSVAAACWGLPCVYAAYRRIGQNLAGECLPLLALLVTAGLAVPGVLVVELVCHVAAMIEEQLDRRRSA
jgi:hypothetical protein